MRHKLTLNKVLLVEQINKQNKVHKLFSLNNRDI